MPNLEDLCPEGLDTRVPQPGVELKGVTLECRDWSGADLTGINFSESTLRGIDMTDANLDDSNFDGTTVNGAQLRGASMARTNLDNTTFEGVDLHDIDLAAAGFYANTRVFFINILAVDYDFAEGIVDFGGVGLHFLSSDLTGANLAGLEVNALSDSIFTGAILDGVFLRDEGTVQGITAVFDGASLRGVRWGSTPSSVPEFYDSSFVGADLTGAILAGANLHRADFTDAIFDGADFSDAQWSDTICPDGTTSDENLGTCDG